MATIISSDKILKHAVSSYNFKTLSLDVNVVEEEFVSALVQAPQEEQKDTLEETPLPPVGTPEIQDASIDASSMSRNSKDALIESLMKKTDEMSSNFIKLQMKLEDKEEEYKVNAQVVQDEAFAKGFEEGVAKATQDSQNNYKDGISQFSTSIVALEAKSKEFESSLEAIKSDLITAAIDIAQEVISIELEENSSKIATVLGEGLIKELQGASNITLKVNPKDHGPVSEQVGKLDNISILSDSAISEGGVIATSDTENIDSQISNRFEKVKKAALSE
ncbi:flagellar assembly protein FliH [Sulfurimonas sp. SAG-AH-194-I05]|nr:flagellar assembly protein FliH [Sulfurimonas sp. SAG-AH-194-I05]MDF1875583.1 flagellar assembly protein FliH [Sulfurimonas sp. SAG-AH-194-I05]